MSNINQLVLESLLFSDKTISIDLHKFESGEVNKLLIIGLSGSGKTTLGEYLAKKYKCVYYDTDTLSLEFMSKNIEDDLNPPIGIFWNRLVNNLPIVIKRKERAIIGGVSLPALSKSLQISKEIRDMMFHSSMIILGPSISRASFNILKRSLDQTKKNEKTFFGALSRTMSLTKKNYNMWDGLRESLKFRRIKVPNTVVKTFNVPQL